jgi:predicted Fe-Mo cluster-binding NifX family protein
VPYKIAATSSDGKRIDQHFGQTERFRVIQVEEATGTWEFLEERVVRRETESNSVTETVCATNGGCAPEKAAGCAEAGCGAGQSCASSGCGGLGHRDAQLQAVIKALADCRYLLTARIGPKPQTVLQRAGITALESPADITAAVSKLHAYHAKYAK